MGKYVFHPQSSEKLCDQYDLIIVGSGATGLVAALQAHELGLRPVILEKMARLGGNSTRASSGMNAAETDVQLHHHVVDTYEEFYNDTFVGGGKYNNVDLLNYFTTHASLSVDWLADRGIHLDDLTITGGMKMQRTHRPSNGAPIGTFLITSFLKMIEQAQLPVFNQVNVKRLIKDDDQLTGVQVRLNSGQDKIIHGNAVILATGGFGASKKIISEYRPDLTHYRTTNQDGATGDGLKLATDVGAALVDMDQIQVHPTVQQDGDHAFLIPEAIRGEGAILVDQNGQRFTNELATRDKVTAAINDLPTKSAYLILDQVIRDQIGAIDFYDSMGLIVHGDDLSSLAKEINVDVDQFKSTVSQWNKAVHQHHDGQFGRTTGMKRSIDHGPYFAIHIAPAVHYTMGGLKVNHLTEVLNVAGHPINGLFAGGEVTGGLHGHNRIGGNSISETVVFGRKAGQRVFQYLKKEQF